MVFRRLFLLFLIIQFNLSKSNGQEILIQNFKTIDKIGNYLISNVRNYIDDPYGFTWIATQDGLFRYDSRDVTYYNSLEKVNHRICGSDVRSLAIDSSNKLLWCAATTGGINAIDLITGNVAVSVNESNTQLIKENTISKLLLNGNFLYLCTSNGICRYDIKNKKISLLKGTENQLFQNMIIYNNLLILLHGGKAITVYDLVAEKITDSISMNNLQTSEAYRIFDVAKINNNEWLFSGTKRVKEAYYFSK